MDGGSPVWKDETAFVDEMSYRDDCPAGAHTGGAFFFSQIRNRCKTSTRLRDHAIGSGSACPIKWMVRIERITIEPDIRTITALLNETLTDVVAVFAQTLQFPGPEFIDVTAMRLDVIADRRQHRPTLGETKDAERMLAKLVRTQTTPAGRRIEMIKDGRTTAHTHDVS
jgi:hypothetical protein